MRRSDVPGDDRSRLELLARILSRAESAGPSALSEAELLELPRLYRFAASYLARLRTTDGAGTGAAEEPVRILLAKTHALLHRDLERTRGSPIERFFAFFLHEVPRAIRGEWKVIAASFGLLYGTALVAFLLVRADLDLAWSLMSPAMVSQEIGQLEETAHGQPFRGNFTFGLGRSPETAGWIMTHNMSAGVLFFGLGLLPPLFVLALGMNGMMVGTYTAVASHWGQGLSISSILWCHGVIELQAIVLAGAAGLVLIRAWIAPGPWSRRHAMSLESHRAWRLLAPVFPMLFVAGTIEGFVSPHAPTAIRVAVAGVSALMIGAWIAAGGRRAETRAKAP